MAQFQQEAALLEVRAALKKIEEHDQTIEDHCVALDVMKAEVKRFQEKYRKARRCVLVGAERINSLEIENGIHRKQIAFLMNLVTLPAGQKETKTMIATRKSWITTKQREARNAYNATLEDGDAPALGVTPTSVLGQEMQVAAQQPVKEQPRGAAVGEPPAEEQPQVCRLVGEMMTEDCAFALFLRVL